MNNPYEILQLDPGASAKEVKSAYRRLCRQYHPDRNPGDQRASERLQEVMDAYQQITAGPPSANADHLAADNGDLFPNLSPDADSQQRQEEIEISFSQAFSGVKKTFTIHSQTLCQSCAGSGAASGQRPRQCQQCQGRGRLQQQGEISPCPECQGRGFLVDKECPDCQSGRVELSERVAVKIPAGVWSGYRIPVIRPGARLDVLVRVANSPIFQRRFEHPEDLHLLVPITYSEAVIGAQVTIPTPEKIVGLKIPPGTPSGKKFKISGQGMPVVNKPGKRGDLLVEAQIAVSSAENLSGKERRIIDELAKQQSGEQLRQDLFKKIS
jgi:molecular chaperone DnaJ